MLVKFDKQPRATNNPVFGDLSKSPDTDFQNSGKLTLYAYEQLDFPNVFKKHAKASISEKLDTSSDISEIFHAHITPNPNPKDRETLIRNWFKFFDRVFFFEGLGQISVQLMFDKHPHLPENGAFIPPNIIYVNTAKVFDENENEIWNGDWSAWMINLLLHEMLHAFIYSYSYDDKLSAERGGVGEQGHGRPFASSLVHLNDALKTAVEERAPRKFKVEGLIPAVVIDSMCQESWRPGDINEALSWGLSKDIFRKLTGDWGKIPSAPDYLHDGLHDLYNNLAVFGTLERATNPDFAQEYSLPGKDICVTFF